ncbi:hypothetical protein BU17DRAFT_91079 [Hysterangium stoloniferum]|nr:hypothetical protein BU17DRAFT_91079 [Hysterangium stoloniferum]
MPFELNHEDYPIRRRPSKIVSLALIVLGGAALVVPLILSRRVQSGKLSQNAKSLGNTPPPPIRRSSFQYKTSESLRRMEWSIMSSRNPGSSAVAHKVTDVQAPSLKDQTTQNSLEKNDPFYALKAFGIATCIVGVTAAAGVWAVRRSMNVQTTEQFAEKIRAKLQYAAPVLSTRIFRSLALSDSSPISLFGSVTNDDNSHTAPLSDEQDDEALNWDDTSERLSQAFEDGGLAKWCEVAWREMEREAHIERKRRVQGSSTEPDRES